MNHRVKALKDPVGGCPTGNQSQINHAVRVLQEMALEAVSYRQSGTIGVEIPVKDGRFGKVKQLQIVFHPE